MRILSDNLAIYQSVNLPAGKGHLDGGVAMAGSKQARADGGHGVTVEAVDSVNNNGKVGWLGYVCQCVCMYLVTNKLVAS